MREEYLRLTVPTERASLPELQSRRINGLERRLRRAEERLVNACLVALVALAMSLLLGVVIAISEKS